MTGLLMVWMPALSAFAGCSLSGVMSSDTTLAPVMTPLAAAHSSEVTKPATLSARETESKAPSVLQSSDLKSGQHVCLITHRTSGTTDEENTIDEQTAALEMFLAVDKVTGMMASADSDQIVLRDVVITSKRSVDSTWNAMDWITRPLGPSQGATFEIYYTMVPGELLVPRKTIRAAKEMTAEEAKNMVNEATKNQPKYIKFDFNVGEPKP